MRLCLGEKDSLKRVFGRSRGVVNDRDLVRKFINAMYRYAWKRMFVIRLTKLLAKYERAGKFRLELSEFGSIRNLVNAGDSFSVTFTVNFSSFVSPGVLRVTKRNLRY